MKYEVPRRSRLDLNTPAEKIIYDAIQVVEKVGADVKLTEAVMLLSKARYLVADFVDSELKKYPSIVVDDVTYWYDKDFEWKEKGWYDKPALILFENIQKANLIIFDYKEGDLFKYHYHFFNGASHAACMSKP